MTDEVDLDAAALELLAEMEEGPADAHEIYLRLTQILNGMRAMGMPLPEDLVRLEKELSVEFRKGSDAD